MQPETTPTPEPRPGIRATFRIAIVVVVLVVVALVAFVIVYPLTQQPKIALVNLQWTVSGGCGFFEPGRFAYTGTFAVVNAGNADGFASVNFHVGAEDRGSVVYFAPQGSTEDKSTTIYGDWGCPAGESPSASILGTWKA
jgi:hypothetical protein